MTEVCLTISPTEFFRDHVSTAASEMSMTLNENVEFYLVNLLCDFINLNKMEQSANDLDVLNTPMAMMLKQAIEAPDNRKLKLYKNMADTSLYLSGYFQDYFNKKLFNVAYYIDMGKTAYHSLSELMESKHGDKHSSNMYRHLGDQFDKFAEVLAIVSDKTDLKAGDTGTLELYDRWTQTGSERVRKELNRRGIDPIKVKLNKAQ